MKLLTVTAVLSVCLTASGQHNDTLKRGKESPSPAILIYPFLGRQFSLLSIFTFQNSECLAGVDGTLGECYTAAECLARGGVSTNPCASGIGVCCYVVQDSCQADNEIVHNNTYIRSPGYTDSYSNPGTCSHRIIPINSNICQFRLDFHTMDLAKPETGQGNGIDGECRTDSIAFIEVGRG